MSSPRSALRTSTLLAALFTFVTIGCVEAEPEAADPVVLSERLGVGSGSGDAPMCTEPQLVSVSGTRFAYGTNNCHHFANCFADRNTRTAVVQCGGDVVARYGGHTIDLAPDPDRDDGKHYCLVEPQNNKKCCWEERLPRNETCTSYSVDISRGGGAWCARRMCKQGYFRATCRVLGEGERARTIQSTLDTCVSGAEDGPSCAACCQTEADILVGEIWGWCFATPGTSGHDDSELVRAAGQVCAEQCRARFSPPPPHGRPIPPPRPPPIRRARPAADERRRLRAARALKSLDNSAARSTSALVLTLCTCPRILRVLINKTARITGI